MTAVSAAGLPEQRLASSTLPGALERAAASSRGYTVVRLGHPDEQLSFTDLARRAGALGRALRRRGLRRGERVCLLSPTSCELLVAIWGVWSAGGVVVVLSLPPRQAEMATYLDELQRRLEQASPHSLLVSPEIASVLPAVAGDVPILSMTDVDDDTVRIEEDADAADARVAPDDVAVLQFTSGTTARSRAVALTHSQMLSNVAAMSAALSLTDADRGLSWLPLFHDMGMLIMIVAVSHPGDLVVLPTEEFGRRPGAWMDTASRFRSTITIAPSTGYSLAAKDLGWRPRPLDLSDLRIAGNGAEPVDATVIAAFVKAAQPYGLRPAALCPMYGLAEATLAVAVVRPEAEVRPLWVARDELESARKVVVTEAGAPGARRLVSCGPPVPGTTIQIRRGDEVLPDGLVGEITVNSPSVMNGYWNDPEATAATVRDGWLHTGDLGFLHHGELVVCGRLKDMIIVGGRNLYPEDYEQLAARRDGVRRGNVVAFGLLESERMVVVAESRLMPEPARDLAENLLKDMTVELSHAPEEVLVIRPGGLPKTSSGKVQRDQCRRLYQADQLPVVASVRRR